MVCVYKVTNNVTGMQYIGITKNIQQRMYKHSKYGYYLHKSIKKYGIENFSYEILANCSTYEIAGKYEVRLIKKYNTLAPNGYNLVEGGEYLKLNDAVKAKIANSKKNYKFTEEHLANLRKAAKVKGEHRKGIRRPPFSEEWKKAISKGRTGLKLNQEHKDNISKALRNSEKFKNCNKGDYFKTNNPNKNPLYKERIAKAKWKKVECVNTGEIFDSIKHAANHFKLTSSSISTAMSRGNKIYGLTFKKVEE